MPSSEHQGRQSSKGDPYDLVGRGEQMRMKEVNTIREKNKKTSYKNARVNLIGCQFINRCTIISK